MTPIGLLIFAVVLAGCIGIVMVVARAAGIAIPPFVLNILWIVLVVVVAVCAIRFLAGLL